MDKVIEIGTAEEENEVPDTVGKRKTVHVETAGESTSAPKEG
jgi:hypothetical protein